MKKVWSVLLTIVLGIIAVAVFLVLINVYFSETIYHPVEGYYDLPTDDNNRVILYINDKTIEMIYTDEYNTVFGKASFKTNWKVWNHLIGNVFLRDNSFLSAKTAPKECVPVSVNMVCTKNYYCDVFANQGLDVCSNDESIGTAMNYTIFFFDDYIEINGEKIERKDSLGDDVLEEVIRLFIDPAIEGETE